MSEPIPRVAWVGLTEGAETGLWLGCYYTPPSLVDEVAHLCWDLHRLPCCMEGGDTGTDSGCWRTDADADDDWARSVITLKEAARRKAAGEHPIGLDKWASDVVK